MRTEKHSKAWLCQRYNITGPTLSRWLMPIIEKNKEVFENYNPNSRLFTPRQITAIVEHLGPFVNEEKTTK